MSSNEEGDLQRQDAAAATTAGASSVQANAYLAAGAVVAYTARALWLKLRKMTLGRSKANKDRETEDSFEAAFEDQGQQKLHLCPS